MPSSPWPEVPIGQFAWEVNEQPHSADVEVLSVTKHEGFVPSLQYFGKQVFSKDTSKYKLVRRGQFAYATIHLDEGSIDSLRIRDFGVISPMYTVFDVDSARVDRKFVLDLLSSPMMVRRYRGIGQGSVNRRKSIGFDTLALEKVSLPPLAEQKKIAAILSSVDEAIQATEAVIEQTRRVKEGLLQELLTRGIGHTRFKETDAGCIPNDWEVRRLDELASIERGKFSHRPRNAPHLYGGEYPFVQTGDVSAADDFLVQHTQTLNEAGLAYSRLFPTNAILITIAANIGDVALTTYPVATPDSVVCILPKAADPLWLLYALQQRKRSLSINAPESAQKNINLQTLRPLPVAVPPREEQLAIGTILGAAGSAIRAAEQEQTSLRALKAGLLQDLLTGKVRVST